MPEEALLISECYYLLKISSVDLGKCQSAFIPVFTIFTCSGEVPSDSDVDGRAIDKSNEMMETLMYIPQSQLDLAK